MKMIEGGGGDVIIEGGGGDVIIEGGGGDVIIVAKRYEHENDLGRANGSQTW